MNTFRTDFAHRAAAKLKRNQDMNERCHMFSETIAWIVVIGISVATFALAVLGVAK